jgi:hypothetical protein
MTTESFKAIDIVNHFKQLKSTGEEKWWSKYVTFEWNKIRTGKNSTKWLTVKYTPNLSINPKRLSVVIRNEVHSGQIMPNTAEDVIELKAKFPEARIEQRTMKPSLQFQKWSKLVSTAEDRITPLYDSNHNQIVPGDEYLSIYYQLAHFVDEIFKTEMRERTERATHMMLYLSKNKTASAKELKEEVGHLHDCDTIMRDDDANSIRERYPDKFNEIMKGVLTVSSTKVGTLIQERISDKAAKNGGAKLPNPITRITIPLDAKPKTSTLSGVKILDKSKPFRCGDKKGFEDAKYNGIPVDANNIHLFIPSRSVIDGVVSMDSVCFSQLGISLPIKASVIVVQQPIKRENNIFTVCNDIFGDDFDAFEGVENTEISTSSTYAESSVSESVSSKDINEAMLKELGI